MTQKILIALIGLTGVVIGAVIAVVGPIVANWLKERAQKKLDDKRKALLTKMLERREWTWRKLSRLSHVIGADEETTKRLLLELDARGSEDEQNLWGLTRRNPFKDEM